MPDLSGRMKVDNPSNRGVGREERLRGALVHANPTPTSSEASEKLSQ